MALKLESLDARLRDRIKAQLAADDAAAAARAALPHAQQCQCAETLARGDEGETQGAGLPHCRFTLVRKKLLDVDAKYSSVKDLLDGLAIAGIIPGDKEGQITLEVLQRKTTKGEPEQTIIEVI
jgi:hypothetical protein